MLVANGRMSSAAVASALGMSTSTASVRIRRLVQCGVIAGFHADVDPAAFGHPFHVLVGVRLGPRTTPAEFERAVAADPRVVEAWCSTGDMDYHLRLACAGVAELDGALLTLRGAGAEQTVTTLLMRRIPGGVDVPDLQRHQLSEHS